MKRPLALTMLLIELAHLFGNEWSQKIVTDAGIPDREIDASTVPLTRWRSIVNESLRRNRLDKLVEAAAEAAAAGMHEDRGPRLRRLLRRIEDWLTRHEMSHAQLADNNTNPPTGLEILLVRLVTNLERALIGTALAVVLGLAFVVYRSTSPSRTSLTVAGVDEKTLTIEVKVANDGGRSATLTDDYQLTFPPQLPIKPQKLQLAGNTRIVPGHDETVIHLTAAGLEPIVMSDGSYLTGEDAVKRLPRQNLTLHYRIDESSGSEHRALSFRADLIRELVKNKLPE